KPYRAAIDRRSRDTHLRQARNARGAGEAHDPRAEFLELRTGYLNLWRNAGRGRQRQDCPRHGDLPDMIARLVDDLAGRVGLRPGDGGGKLHALLNPGADIRLVPGDERSERLPGLV